MPSTLSLYSLNDLVRWKVSRTGRWIDEFLCTDNVPDAAVALIRWFNSGNVFVIMCQLFWTSSVYILSRGSMLSSSFTRKRSFQLLLSHDEDVEDILKTTRGWCRPNSADYWRFPAFLIDKIDHSLYLGLETIVVWPVSLADSRCKHNCKAMRSARQRYISTVAYSNFNKMLLQVFYRVLVVILNVLALVNVNTAIQPMKVYINGASGSGSSVCIWNVVATPKWRQVEVNSVVEIHLLLLRLHAFLVNA